MTRISGALILIAAGLLTGCGEKLAAVSATGDAHAAPANTAVANSSPNAPVVNANSPAVNGSKPGATNAGMNEAVATVNGEPITMQRLVDPLLESRGLTMLVNLVELELARQNAAGHKPPISVTQQDFDEEHDRQLEKLFKDSDDAKLIDALTKAMMARTKAEVAKNSAEVNKWKAEEARIEAEIKLEREDYLTQLLVNKNIDRVEWDFGLKINTYLRKILESEWKDKITEEDVKNAYGQMYGERVKVRYILLENMKEVIQSQRRLHDGDSFAQVAMDMSHDKRTAALGGELPPFSRDVPDGKVPKVFRETSFALRDGQVSEPLLVGSSYMLIKREAVIAPVAVKYEDVRDSVFRKLNDTLMEAGVKGMKQQLGIEAGKAMVIYNPLLKRQLNESTERRAKAEAKAKAELDLQQHIQDGIKHPGTSQPADNQPTSQGTAPATGAAPQAPGAAAGERPPATMPDGVHAFTLPRLGIDTQPSTVPPAK